MSVKAILYRKPVPGRRPGALLPNYSNVRTSYLVEHNGAQKSRWLRDVETQLLPDGLLAAFERF